jgi:hypothetical protein
MFLIFLSLWLVYLSPSVWAQEMIGDVDVANLFHDEQRTLSCERYKKLSEFLKGRTSEEAREQLQGEIAANSLLLKKEDLSFKERKIFRAQIRILKKLLRYQDKNQGIANLQEDICKGAQAVGRIGLHGVAWTANGIMTGVAVPVEALGKLTYGLIKGKVREGYGQIYYDFIGPTAFEGIGGSLLFSQRYLQLAFAAPWIFPIIAAPTIEAEVLKICKRKHSLRKEEEKFCENYLKFKTNALKLSKPFEKLGANIHNLFNGKKEEQVDTVPYTQEEILKDMTKLSDENFCTQMMEIGKKFKKSKKEIRAKADLETWRIGTNPERYGMPDILDFTTSKENLLKQDHSLSLRNVVIAMGPASWQTEGLDKKLLTKNYQKNFKLLKKQLKVGRKIFQSASTVEQCERLKKKHNFQYQSFEDLATKVDEDMIGKHLFEAKRIRLMLNTQTTPFNIRGSKLSWEFIETGDIEAVHQILRSRDVGNVILVMHGTEKGKLIDSNNNEIPRTFFNQLSPTIMSLNFFSCFSQKIDQYYGISKELMKGKTQHLKRHLSFVELNPEYSYKSGQVPFESFPGFFKKIDFYLQKSLRGNLLYQNLANDLNEESTTNMCELHIQDLGQKTSTFSVTINNIHVGSVASARSKSQFQFDCSILKLKNALRLMKISLDHQEPLTVNQSHFKIVLPDSEILLNTSDLDVIELNGDVLGITGSF